MSLDHDTTPIAPPRTGLGAATVLGYPRVGPRRELKRALETYWDGGSTPEALLSVGATLRESTWRRLESLGLAGLPSNTFSLYDHVLDTALMLDAVPDRFRGLGQGDGALDTYFAMARGDKDVAPLPMTKWFDTNYHYIVPEIGASTPLRLVDTWPVDDKPVADKPFAAKPVAEVREARALGLSTRPVLLGPVTFLLLSAPAPGSPAAFSPLHRLDDVVRAYAQLLVALAADGVEWVQFDEPALVADRTGAELAALRSAYDALAAVTARPCLLVATYFGDPGEALPVLAATAVDAIGIDLIRGPSAQQLADRLASASKMFDGKALVAGVVSGRDVWRTDLAAALDGLRTLRGTVGELVVGTSCSLLHVPHDLELETDLDSSLRDRLAFADQKVAEVVTLADLVHNPGSSAPARPATTPPPPMPRSSSMLRSPSMPLSSAPPSAAMAEPIARGAYPVRAAAQAEHLRLPLLPVTTIGSFPQTDRLRAARAAAAAGQMEQARYKQLIMDEIEHVIRVQERLGIDVLVHGEPERNDMVQYFAEHLDGFATTRHGWVQSYGSRCTRPPILHGEVRRPAPITVGWATYAQSLTDRPVKGMLTGPVTIVAWSFVRRDLPLRDVVDQVAEALRDEVRDLESAGISVIQVDEPALRELLPLRGQQQGEYLTWAVRAYRRATSGVSDRTQIHTHVCYSNAAQVLTAIDALDADVTTIESTRSEGRILAEPALARFARGLGPGVYDVHSPRVPAVDEVADLLTATLRVLPAQRVWVNPDCGLKTRTYAQVEAALGNVVAAAHREREALLQAP